MKNIIIAIIIASGLFIVWSALEKKPDSITTKQAQEAINNEYVVDSSDMYSPEKEVAGSAIPVTPNEKKWLLWMREEEKLARDVYTMLGNRWGLRIFPNIAASEQTHTDAIKVLLMHYDIKDPSVNDKVGVFTAPEMQKLYDELVTEGNKSMIEALVVGATVEDLDIEDLANALAETEKSDIIRVYKNLQKGSRNHLRAFVRNIEASGGTYAPQYISKESFEMIISSPQEKGRVE